MRKYGHMFWERLWLFAVLWFVALFTARSQELTPRNSWLDFHKKADKLYNAAEPTETTDSLALQSYQQVIKLLGKEHIADTLLFDSFVKSGILLTGQKKDALAIQHFFEAIQLNSESRQLADSISFLPWLFAGSSYYNLFDFDSALVCYKRAEQLFVFYPGLPEAERLYNKLGVLYYEAGDYQKSIPYFRKALSIVNNGNANNQVFIINYTNNLASSLRKLRLYDEALHIYKSLLPYKVYVNEVRHNIGVTYLDAGKYAEALKWLQEVQYNNATKYNDMATACLALAQMGKATMLLQAAMKTYSNVQAKPNADQARTLKLWGDVLMASQQSYEALKQYHLAIGRIIPGFTDTALTKNPVSFGGLYNFFSLFDILTSKAKAFVQLYRQSPGQLSWLHNAFHTYSSALTLAEYMEQVYGSDEARFFLKKTADTVYGAAIEIGLELYDRTKDTTLLHPVFRYMENSKASVLHAGVSSLELSFIRGMPSALLNRERVLKGNLGNIQFRLTQTVQLEGIIELQKQQREAELQLSAVQEQLLENTLYYKLKFGSGSNSIQDIQHQLLAKDQTMLSFYQTSKHLICFYISPQHYGMVYTPADAGLKQEVIQLRRQCSAADGGSGAEVTRLSQALYHRLLTPVSKFLTDAARLVIIPHNELSYLPFEILSHPKTGRLLIEDFAISYQYSANFMTRGSAPPSSYKVLAMAPFITARPDRPSHLPALISSAEEIRNLPGKTLFDTAATKKSFILLAPEFPVLHLATHAVAEDSSGGLAYIAFYDPPGAVDTAYRLYQQEIYYMDMSHTQLAILSACETGTGQLVDGEGIISLSRAFSYAGCKSAVTSLWTANDISSAAISKQLHYYLQRGLPLDKALQRAKLDYLNGGTVSLRLKRPVYWANFILMGDANAIVRDKGQDRIKRYLPFVATLTVIIVGLLAVMLKNRKRRMTNTITA